MPRLRWAAIWCAAALILGVAPARGEIVPLDWDEGGLGNLAGTAPLVVGVWDGGGFAYLESFEAGPFSLTTANGSVSGVAHWEIDGNRWSYGVDQLQASGSAWSWSVGFTAAFDVPPGDDVQFIGFRDANAVPDDESSELGLTDVRIYAAGDRIRLFRSFGGGSPGGFVVPPGEIELFWLVPEPGGTVLAACACATLAALRARGVTRL